jgi:hypothetical protein
MSFILPGSSGGAPTTPSAPVGSVQFNNAGAFGGDAGFTYDSITSFASVGSLFGSLQTTMTIRPATRSSAGDGWGLDLLGGVPAATNPGGPVQIQAGASTTSTGGAVSLAGGTGATGGAVNLSGGFATGGATPGGNVNITAGDSGSSFALTGQVRIRNAVLNNVLVVGNTAGGASTLGLFNVTPAIRQTVTGSRGGNAALASLLTAGATNGFWIDSSTA